MQRGLRTTKQDDKSIQTGISEPSHGILRKRKRLGGEKPFPPVARGSSLPHSAGDAPATPPALQQIPC